MSNHVCILCGNAFTQCICEEFNIDSVFGSFFHGVQSELLPIDHIQNFVSKMEKEALALENSVIRNELLHSETENCHLCGYYYTDCTCRQLQSDSLFGTMYRLLRNNRISAFEIYDFVDQTMKSL